MQSITLDDIVKGMSVVIDTVIENEAYFSELDSAAGDGDFGSSLAKGFKELKLQWDSLNKDDIGIFMKSCSMIIMDKCGGASGPIWGSAFREAGRYAKGKDKLDLNELADLFHAMVEGVKRIGGADLGDKTLLDALIPTSESLHTSASTHKDMLTALRACVKAAEDGAESTKAISAKKGRASYLGKRSIGYYDAGAQAIAVILATVVESFLAEEGAKDENSGTEDR